MLKLSSIIYFFCFALFASKHAEAVFGIGKCLNAPIISNFNASAYSGLWYEITKFPVIYELGLTCVTAEYGYVNSTYVTVKNSGFNKLLNNRLVTEGRATVSDPTKPNYLTVTFLQNLIVKTFETNGPYRVWETDYTNYSIVYSCTETNLLFFTLKDETVWILGRNKNFNSTLQDSLKAKIKSVGININNFQQTDQSC